MLLIYTESDSPRLQYILRVLFRETSMLEFRVTTDLSAFNSHAGPRLNYSRSRIAEYEFFLPAHGLLSEPGIREQAIQVSRASGLPVFFETSGGDFPFDIFAAAFYLVSRYEEYLPHQKDRYGRFDHRLSLAFREGFLDRPLVNEWMKSLRQALRRRFPELFLPEPTFRFIPTYDIDIAFAFRCRRGTRRLGGWLRDLSRGDFAQLSQRFRVLVNGATDPYDVYEWLDALHIRYRLRPLYFFLLAERHMGYDRNIDPREPAFRALIRYHGMGYDVGMHPSWQSGDDAWRLASEKSMLEEITGREITASRQHYIRMNLPDTYRKLLALGIRDDYSMGYGSVNGFRASLAASFTWYDLDQETATGLRIHPFCFMDANAKFEEGLPPAKAFEALKVLHDRVKQCGGTLYTVFHNQFLGSHPHYAGWREVYELFLEEVVYWDV
jgi:hypothetical protein